ncbi:MAG TPA: hypothetical protein VFE50_07680 [Cyclobacteriaceae bacterium]|nr:hypothetical protein [Cyclobacteriaceae bacterium]
MKKIYQYIFIVFAAVSLVSCDKDFEDDLVRDNRPEIPVTFTGATTYGFNPYYTVQYASNAQISFTLSIPADKGRKIVRLKKITAGGTALLPGSLYDATAAYAANVSVDGTQVTFSTTLSEFNTKMAAANRVTAAPAAGTFTERAFMFLIVLDDNTEIVPVQCRLRFVP